MDKKFSKKKVAVLGFGMEGQDLCRFLLSQKAQITVFDEKKNVIQNGIEFKNSLQSLASNGFAFIFRSPGFSPLRPEIVEAEKKGALISSSTKLFFDLCPGKIIGVTGTKGKGTTATLVYEIL